MMAIDEYLKAILSAVKGKEVRQSIHDAIHTCYEDGRAGAIDLTARENISGLEKRVSGIIAQSGTSDTEVVSARVNAKNGQEYTDLPERLDAENEELSNGVNQLKDDIDSVANHHGYRKINLNLVKDKNIDSTGGFVDGIYGADNTYYPVNDGDILVFTGTPVVKNDYNIFCLVYMYSDAVYTSYVKNAYILSSGNPSYVEIPDGVKYVRFKIAYASASGNVIDDEDISNAEVSLFAKKSRKIQVTTEHGALDLTTGGGVLEYHSGYLKRCRTAYMVSTENAVSLKVETSLPITYQNVYFYDESFSLIVRKSGVGLNYSIPYGTKYVKVATICDDNVEPEPFTIQFIGARDEPKEYKNACVSGEYEIVDYDVDDGVWTTSRLMLPPNYSVDGKKVPLIIWLHGSASFYKWNSDMETADYYPYLKYLRDEGYAILTVHGASSKYYEMTSANNVPNTFALPICMKCYEKGVEHILSRYNIDANNIHAICKSLGGNMANYWCVRPPKTFAVKSISMLAPWTGSLSGINQYGRQLIAAELELSGDDLDYYKSADFAHAGTRARAFYLENLDKLNGYDSKWIGVVGKKAEEKLDHTMSGMKTQFDGNHYSVDTTDWNWFDLSKICAIPVKCWMCELDRNTSYFAMYENIVQMQNAGFEASMVTIPVPDEWSETETGAYHHLTDSMCEKYPSLRANDITTRLGVHYDYVPFAFKEAVDFMRKH